MKLAEPLLKGCTRVSMAVCSGLKSRVRGPFIAGGSRVTGADRWAACPSDVLAYSRRGTKTYNSSVGPWSSYAGTCVVTAALSSPLVCLIYVCLPELPSWLGLISQDAPLATAAQ